MKKFLTTILALCMLFSLGAVAHADEHDHDVANGVGEQIKFLAGRFADLEQKDDGNTWYYAVSDLDHNGRLELLATTRTPGDMSWLKVWEIGPDGKTLTKCTEHSIPAPIGSTEETITAEGMLLNLRSNSTDTYYDKGSNTYYYLFTDVAEGNGKRLFLPVPGSNELIAVGSYVTTGVGAASLKDGSMQNSIILGSCTSYSVDDGDLKVICRNGKLEEITLQEFLDISLNAFQGLPHFSTAFDWFSADEAGLLQRFVDSYAVFDGVRDMDNAEGGVAFMASQSAGGVYITKNPTDEKHNEGQTAEFIAEASIYDDVTWTFIAPDGRTYNEQEFVRMCGGIPEGTKTGYLRIKNVNTDMNGWGVFATFDYRGASARTSTAYLYVWAGGSTNDLAAKIDQFYSTKPWLNGLWTCPKCGASVSGSQCWSCGFNPVSFYAIYYGVTPTGYDWYYGLNGQTTVNQIREAYQGAELRLCDYCGQWFNNDYDVCPYCGGAPDDGTLYTQAEYNTYNEYLQGADMRLCQYCGQWFNNDYDACPHCGMAPDDGYADDGAFAGFTAGGNARFTYHNDDGSEYSTVICPYCGYEHSMATNCPNCGGGYT